MADLCSGKKRGGGGGGEDAGEKGRVIIGIMN